MAKDRAEKYMEIAKSNIESGKCESAVSLAEQAKKIYEYVLDDVRKDETVLLDRRMQTIAEYEGYIETVDRLTVSASKC